MATAGAGSAGMGGSCTVTPDGALINLPGLAKLNSSADTTRNAIRTKDRISMASAERRGTGCSGAGAGTGAACILDCVSGVMPPIAPRASAVSVSLVSIGAAFCIFPRSSMPGPLLRFRSRVIGEPATPWISAADSGTSTLRIGSNRHRVAGASCPGSA